MTARPVLVAVLVGAGLAWGSTQALGKIATSTGHGPYGLIFWQQAVATLVTGALMALRRRPLPLSRRAGVFALVIAVVGTVVPSFTFYVAVAHLPAGIMSIVISTVPLLALPMAVALGRDRATAARVAGLLCGLGGVALLAGPGAASGTGIAAGWLLVALVGPLLYAAEANFVASFGTAGLDPVQAIFLASATALALALPLALASGQWVDPRPPWGAAEAALVASATISVLTYVVYVWLAGQAGAVFACQLSYVVTGSGVLWAMALLGETLSPWAWLALGLMLGGLVLVRPREASPAAPLAAPEAARL